MRQNSIGFGCRTFLIEDIAGLSANVHTRTLTLRLKDGSSYEVSVRTPEATVDEFFILLEPIIHYKPAANISINF